MKVKRIGEMQFQLEVLNPFIVCFHHRDHFPKGNNKMEPIHNMNKTIGEDFDHDAPWRMYYGKTVPGFLVHPHRGFETITVVMEGFADHFDSLGSKGRYGQGDVQWMTAGAGIQHSEMFPAIFEDKDNPMELFQIWLNLPKKDKFAKPDYKMFWNEDIPIVNEKDRNGNNTQVRIIAGDYKSVNSLDPLPNSWAYDRNNMVGIWLLELDADAEFTIQALPSNTSRMLYYYEGEEDMLVGGENIPLKHFAELAGNETIEIKNGKSKNKLLLLQGKPIDEPVAAHGPFVMNTTGELREAFTDYQATQFGGWPWSEDGPINEQNSGRFADYQNGSRIERPKE